MHQPDNPALDPNSAFSPSIDELRTNNERYAAEFHDSGLALRPKRQLAIVACMDSRMNVFQILGLVMATPTSSAMRAEWSPMTSSGHW
jgi:hypothetical protein